jgi:N-acetylglucosaminyl-diphospho-decaprenol L-rhamnosyltransferase
VRVRLSIVVVTWRSAADLRRLIASMRTHFDDQTELVVVDNASSDGVATEVAGWPGRTRLIALERNIGYGAAANRGVEAAGGQAIVLLNPDTELVDASLSELAAFALERRAIAGPRLLGSDGSPQPSASGPPVGAWPWLGAVWPGRLQPRSLQARTEPWRLDRTAEVAWLAGACAAAPRDVLRSLGPYDPSIHLYGEDMDLGLRASRAGVPSYFCPDVARVVHHGRGSTSQLLPEGPWDLMAVNRRAVLRRAFGHRRERASHAALVVNLGLRSAAKRALGRAATRDRAALRAALSARAVPALPPEPSSSLPQQGA